MSEAILKEVRGWMEQGLKGRRLAEQYTSYMDAMLAAIFAASGNPQDLLLLATGGYGRNELAPYSDIDIMFFAENRKNPSAAEPVLYRLWDTKLDISHAFRTSSECVEEAFRDIRTRTTLLEARYVAGSRRLYERFMSEVYPAVAFRKQKQFVAEKLNELAKRHLSTGDSVFLLEPHIKEGDGGLRDIHTVLWLCRVVFRIADFRGLEGFLGSHDYKRLMSAYDFMIQSRYCLHLESGRKNDILSFEFQRSVAASLGFTDSKKFSGPERMMRYHYLKSRAVRDISHAVMVRCSRQYTPVFRDFTRKKINEDFAISGGRLIARSEDLFSKRPEKIMEAFYHFCSTGRKFSDLLRIQIRENLLRINRRTGNIQSSIHFFLEIMKSCRVYETLREMNETGVLGRFIPEFGALRSLVLHEAYHMYTVDEHTLFAIRNLERLMTTTVKSLEPLKNIISGFGHIDLLFLSILFHDIGKAVGRRHEEEGYKRLKNIMERIRMEPERRQRIEFLVRNHVLMSRIAMTREIDDPEVIASFADAVGDTENLKAIYLVTYADMSAVNPHFWTAWKASLLNELYERTLLYLSGCRDFRAACNAEELFPGQKTIQEEFAEFVSAMPERYLISTTDSRLREDFLLYQKTKERGAAVSVNVRPEGFAEVVVCASDAPGLFSGIVGFFTLKKLNIVHGRIYTGKTGIVIDKISLSNWKDVWWEGLENDVVAGIEDVLLNRRNIQLPGMSGEDHGIFDSFVEVDNETSETYTLIEIFSRDRIGLLYDISMLLYRNGIDIVSARINTEAGLAQDTFSVQTKHGKLNSETGLKTLNELWNRIKN